MHSHLNQPVTTLSGIGAQTAQRLAKLGIHRLQDLLFHLPFRYQDRSQITPIQQLQAGSVALVCGSVEYTDNVQRGRRSVLCRISDGTGLLSLRFFHFTAQQAKQLKPGVQLGCYGEIRAGYHGLEMVHPEYRLVQTPEQLIDACLTPVYPLSDGLSQSVMRKTIQQALQRCLEETTEWPEYLPRDCLEKYRFPNLPEALSIIHSPPKSLSTDHLMAGNHPAIQRLVVEELLAHHLALLQGKQSQQQWRAPVLVLNETIRQAFLQQLPFQLTAAQVRVVADIESDLRKGSPMLRLVQGDVGSGKTVVAALAALSAANNGYQVALMAPTELLAEQHFHNFRRWFSGLDVQVDYLSGQLKGNARRQVLSALAEGRTQIVIGTHALFQAGVEFMKLGLIVIDEQHRFGVQQRLALREKGQQAQQRPHQLIMTATPIPRTQAMLQYADLDLSVIDQLPPGRKPITTRIMSSERRDEVIERISHWVAEHRQVYWVCTLIEESEVLQCEAAEKTQISLSQALPQVSIGLVHGRMKPSEKDRVMHAFKSGEIDLLVATTVIEVGVDVPNASLMVIENPERLGLAQLHQLRGRVGRGSQDSYCLLLYQSPLSAISKQRLAIIKQHQDGFLIAEQDLLLRGPGEIMGNRQTGQIQFRIVDLSRDQHWLDCIGEIAASMIKNHSGHVSGLIRRWIGESRQQMQDMA